MTSRSLQADIIERIADFRQILDALELLPGTMFAIKNLESRYVYMSVALRRAIHVDSPEDVIGKSDFDLFPKIIAESFRQNDLIVFQHEKPLLNQVHLTRFFDNAPIWSFSSKFPIHSVKREVIGLVIINEAYEDVMGKKAELNQLLPAIDYVSKHYAHSITIQELAVVCQISASHFMRIFKTSLHMTAYSFVEQVRMCHAIEALKSGTASITQIALDCGFYDHSAFVKRFKKFTGTTPLRYRRSHRAALSGERPIVLPTPVY